MLIRYVCFFMLVSKKLVNKLVRKICLILSEKDRLKWFYYEMILVWNYEVKVMFLIFGEVCRGIFEVGLCLVCWIVWVLIVIKFI